MRPDSASAPPSWCSSATPSPAPTQPPSYCPTRSTTWPMASTWRGRESATQHRVLRQPRRLRPSRRPLAVDRIRSHRHRRRPPHLDGIRRSPTSFGSRPTRGGLRCHPGAAPRAFDRREPSAVARSWRGGGKRPATAERKGSPWNRTRLTTRRPRQLRRQHVLSDQPRARQSGPHISSACRRHRLWSSAPSSAPGYSPCQARWPVTGRSRWWHSDWSRSGRWPWR